MGSILWQRGVSFMGLWCVWSVIWWLDKGCICICIIYHRWQVGKAEVAFIPKNWSGVMLEHVMGSSYITLDNYDDCWFQFQPGSRRKQRSLGDVSNWWAQNTIITLVIVVAHRCTNCSSAWTKINRYGNRSLFPYHEDLFCEGHFFNVYVYRTTLVRCWGTYHTIHCYLFFVILIPITYDYHHVSLPQYASQRRFPHVPIIWRHFLLLFMLLFVSFIPINVWAVTIYSQ